MAVILVYGGYVGMWRLYQTTALLELLWAAKNAAIQKKLVPLLHGEMKLDIKVTFLQAFLVCGGYQGYVAVILVYGGYIGMWRLYRTTALPELIWAAKNAATPSH